MITAIARFERTHTVSRLQAKSSLLEYLNTRNPQAKRSFFDNMAITQSYNKVFSKLLNMRTSKSEKEFIQILETTFKEADYKTAVIIVNRIKVLQWHPIVKELVNYADKANLVGEKILSLGPLAMAANSKERQHVVLRKIKKTEEEFILNERSFSKRCSDLAHNIAFMVNLFSIIILVFSVLFTCLVTYLIASLLLKQAEKNARDLKESEERLHLMLKGSNDAPWDWDLIKNELYYSPQWWSQIGYVPNELSNDATLWQRLLHPDDSNRVNNFFQNALKDGTQSYEVEFRLKHKDGYYVPVLSRGFITRDERGKPIRVSGTNMDLSEKKRMEEERKKFQEQALQSQKMEAIGTLAGGIAHDFNNLLGVITGNISYALNNIKKNNEVYDALLDVQESSKQAQNLTHQLLTFSKGGAPIKKILNINKLINKSAIFSTRGSETSCHFELLNDLWLSDVDEGQINQVIGNLVINANQAMPNGGRIRVRTENTEIGTDSGIPLLAGRYIKIIIEDQGTGIAKNHLPNIFEPYYSTKQKGSGLGLATAYSIIKRHGGHITVYSETGKGTVFNIYLPASSEDIDEVQHKKDHRHSGQGNVLIMDDQESILKMVTRMLNRMGYEVTSAINGIQAINIFQKAYDAGKPFNLVILDLTIPGGMGGAKTIPELLKIDPNVKAVVSSGYSNDPIMANYEYYGFCGVVPKPYTKDQLSEVLNKIFGTHR